MFDDDTEIPKYKDLDGFDNGGPYLEDDQMLGGLILRPLNLTTVKWIETPFLQAVLEYGEGPTIGFFRLKVIGDIITGNSDDKYYDIILLSGPDTSQMEFDYLQEMNMTEST